MPTSNLSALIVGAGAVQNAWAPVIRALQPEFEFDIDGDCANSYLARLVYLLRWWYASDSPQAEEHRRQHLDYLNHIKTRIAEELRLAQTSGELCIRPKFYELIDQFVVQKDSDASFMLVNTNWDTVVDKAMGQHLRKTHDGDIYGLHIHGSIGEERLLYLPSEWTREPYRSKDEDELIGTIHGDTMRGLENASRVVIYGLSLSPLDAELLQILACGFSNPNLSEIHVIVPDHKLVATRVRLLLDPEQDVRIIGHDARDFGKTFNYR